MEKSYTPSEVEEKWLSFWKKHHVFQVDPNSSKKPFSIVLPPPNVTGVLHTGHALVDTLQDILIRKKRMEGFSALWLPGTDHAGIATQSVVEKKLYQETGKKRRDFSREFFVEKIWEFKKEKEGVIQDQLKRLGCSLDWSKYRFTMDEKSCKAVKRAFKTLFDKGLLYRGDYLVNWDPVSQTALSDDEVEWEEKSGYLWYIRYPIEGKKEHIVIATTRPETLLADVAVAVHPQDKRYTPFIKEKVVLPFTHRKIPIIQDSFVDKEFGTGAVKITPAHDFNDYEMGQRHNLERINLLTEDAKINKNGTPLFEGLSIEEARKKIVEELTKKGLLEKVVPHKMRIGVSYRSKAVIQPYLSKQWFIRMDSFKEKLLSLVKEKQVELIPPHWENTYFHWIENLRDWCISRQLWWGHTIPVWYHKKEERILCSEEELPPEVKKEPHLWEKEEDVLDTWFSSALWPLTVLGWPEKTPLLEKFYPTSVLVTGYDILFFWVARMILMGDFLEGKVPFEKAFIHGLIYGKSYFTQNEEGITYITGSEKKRYDLGKPIPKQVESKWEKMSKSKGNVIDPLEVIEEYGADALRITLAFSTTYARQIDLDPRRFEEFKNFINKIWNGARFIFLHCLEEDPLIEEEIVKGIDSTLVTLEDRWILSEIEEVIGNVEKALEGYAFDKAAHLSYSFYWDRFCSLYLEMAKPYLFEKKNTKLRRNKQKILLFCLQKMIRLMHPIIPFVTEELFSYIKNAFPSFSTVGKDSYAKDFMESMASLCCSSSSYPKKEEAHVEKKVVESFSKIENILYEIRKMRGEMNLSPLDKTEIHFIGKKELSFIEENKLIFKALLPVKELFFVEKEPKLFGSLCLIGSIKVFIPLSKELKEREIKRLIKEKEKIEKGASLLQEKLKSKAFLEKAPKGVVEEFQKKLQESLTVLEKLQKKLVLIEKE